MAAQLVGGALLSSFFNVVFDRLSSPEVVNWIRGKKLDQRLLQRLETSLYVVQAVLDDAEQKQITNTAVMKWLTDLEDAVYEADDLLDEIHTKAATRKHPGNCLSRYCKFNLQARKMVAKVEEVIVRLENIARDKDTLHLENISTQNMSWRMSTSQVEESYIYGRDEDKEAIIKLLLDDSGNAKISVIPIVGMGGVGKTTLAQLVYNDDKLKGKFDFKVWVCVGENFDALRMTKIILEKLETSGSCNKIDLDSIQLKVKDLLRGKRFLFILDDMWSDNYDDWRIFQTPFQYGSEGSKIIVTTRNDGVASVVQTIQPYKLNTLSDEDCWSMFVKHASLSPGSRDYSSLEKVGRKIVEKCKGLPLAAQTLGGLLRTKDNVRDWKNILNSEIWENESRILPALRISYHYLPSYAKRCFVFCSLYPKDHIFNRDELVWLWMTEDLLQLSKSGSNIEEFGYDCFNNLASRSFFQPSNINENLFVMHDLMHDLAIFYAGKFYFRASEFRTTADVDPKARHLSYFPENNLVSKFLETFDSLKHARTLLQTSFRMFKESPKEIASSIPLLLSQLKCLRVLCFTCIPLASIPKSIGGLIHLRYFDLSKAFIETLPESLGNLYNLQTLKLRDCRKLKMLPSSMQDLVNLRHLDIRGTCCLKEIPKGMNKLKDLQFLSDYIVGKHNVNRIWEFGELTNLHGSLVIHKLENVSNSGEASDARMSDKEQIDDLKFIWSSSCDNVDLQTKKDIFEKLKPCTEVKKLDISRYRGGVFPDWLGQSSYHHVTVLTLSGCGNCCKLPSLGQLPSLKCLKILQFDKLTSIGAEFHKNDHKTPFPSLETLELHKLPMWQVWHSSQFDAAFSKLKKLSIARCPMLTGNLPNHLQALEELHISGCEQLTCSLPSAPNILKLHIDGVSEVRFQELSLSQGSESISGTRHVEFVSEATTHMQLTSLRSLYISKCSSAISFRGACMPASLQHLQIHGCKNLEFPMQQQRQQESLRLVSILNSCDSLTSFPLAAFPNLTGLRIESCDNMKCLEVPQSKDAAALPPSLGQLEITECPSFVSLLSQSSRNNNAALPSLRGLTILSCGSFASFSTLGKVAPQLEHLRIRDCPEIEIVSFDEEGGDGSLPPTLRTLNIDGCEKLVRCLASSTALHSCRSLTCLFIEGACDSVKSFPREGCLPASLERLYLKHFHSLETLDCKGLLHLTSLQYLLIWDCPKLENIVGESLPASLQKLDIHKCEKLVRCLASSTALHSWRSLTDLFINGACDSVKSFPREGCLPASLETLTLWHFPSLETLDCKGLLHLTSLQKLVIQDCPKLENTVGEKMPASLQELAIYNSPLFSDHRRGRGPQICPKISHIPNIRGF